MPTSLGCYEECDTTDRVPVAITADGGVRLVNPSPHGGMWAFRLTNVRDEPVIQASGVTLVNELHPLTTVSNNLMEVVALLVGLEYLPAGWSGAIRSDSLNALRVFQQPGREWFWLTDEINQRAHAARRRLGAVTFQLLGGHPSKKMLQLMKQGVKCHNKSGHPYCLHNHYCDRALPGAWNDYEIQMGLNDDR